jgi:signal transduction histidine kinase
LLTVLGFCLYAAFEIATLRDRQVASSERNRRDSLQLLRIQNNLSTLAVTMRDMVDGAEPYPMASWKNTFDRLHVDLDQALQEERTLAPARPAGQQAQLAEAATRFWQEVDRALTLAVAKNDRAAVDIVRQSALPRHAELSGLVSQLLIRNTQVEDDAVEAARDGYTRVIRQIYALMAILLAIISVVGIFNILGTRRAFEDLQTVSQQMRALTWRMLRMQEQLQARVARELHDEFGQILTALTMLIGRVKGKAMAAAEDDRDGGDAPEDEVGRIEPVRTGRSLIEAPLIEAPLIEPRMTSDRVLRAKERAEDEERAQDDVVKKPPVVAPSMAPVPLPVVMPMHPEETLQQSATGTSGALGGRFIFSAARLRLVPPIAAPPPVSAAPRQAEEAPPIAPVELCDTEDIPTGSSSSGIPAVEPSLFMPAAEDDDGEERRRAEGTSSRHATFIRDLEEVETLTKDTLERIRNDARLLHPTVLDDFGLEEALCAHVLDFGKRHHIVAWFSRDKPIGQISGDVRSNVFRIVQEALTNVGRHSGTHELWVRLKRKPARLQVEVEDYGRGMPHWVSGEVSARRPAAETGLGMIGMRERAEALGGRFEIKRGERGGVLIQVDMPVDARIPDDSLGRPGRDVADADKDDEEGRP